MVCFNSLLSCRAVIESVCFQVCEIFDAMKADCGAPPSRLLVDGGMTQSELLLQLQANLLGVAVHKPDIKEVRKDTKLQLNTEHYIT